MAYEDTILDSLPEEGEEEPEEKTEGEEPETDDSDFSANDDYDGEI
ncbi:MAG: hypothetical protein V1756_01555 [Patescibacteria group bacterium]